MIFRQAPAPTFPVSPLLAFGPIGTRVARNVDLLVHVGDNPVPRTPWRVTVVKDRFDDGGLPPEEQLQRLVRQVATVTQQGSRVLVTCDEGRNRSALIVGLALHSTEGLSGDVVIERLLAARLPILTNRAFVEHLRALPAGPKQH